MASWPKAVEIDFPLAPSASIVTLTPTTGALPVFWTEPSTVHPVGPFFVVTGPMTTSPSPFSGEAEETSRYPPATSWSVRTTVALFAACVASGGVDEGRGEHRGRSRRDLRGLGGLLRERGGLLGVDLRGGDRDELAVGEDEDRLSPANHRRLLRVEGPAVLEDDLVGRERPS